MRLRPFAPPNSHHRFSGGDCHGTEVRHLTPGDYIEYCTWRWLPTGRVPPSVTRIIYTVYIPLHGYVAAPCGVGTRAATRFLFLVACPRLAGSVIRGITTLFTMSSAAVLGAHHLFEVRADVIFSLCAGNAAGLSQAGAGNISSQYAIVRRKRESLLQNEEVLLF